jgi:excisionase family DNA binding protein
MNGKSPSPDDLLTVAEVTAIIGYHDRTIRTWIRKGLMGVVYVGPFKRPRIRRSEVSRLMKVIRGADA